MDLPHQMMDDEREAVSHGRRRILVNGLWSIILLAGAGPIRGMLKNLSPVSANEIEARHTKLELAAADLDHPEWKKASAVRITRYWSSENAPPQRHAEARLLWSREALCVRFVCPQAEPLVVSEKPQTDKKTLNLWDRDVCEIFIAPDARAVEHYYEFEAAPTGEWVDLAIHWKPDGRETEWEFHSEMTAAGRISKGSVMMAMRVPWQALGRTPVPGERWRANLFRCVGSGAGRGYLAWQPTRTEQPAFHVPQAFGSLFFKG
ncbi:MAG TPA: carbohydrate-binding family 9-like protein [Pyrinomonadaceae bacterium]|nr:carbohydrate-binding family 9-like protein [Pyrinomonadaceae bacterium]